MKERAYIRRKDHTKHKKGGQEEDRGQLPALLLLQVFPALLLLWRRSHRARLCAGGLMMGLSAADATRDEGRGRKPRRQVFLVTRRGLVRCSAIPYTFVLVRAQLSVRVKEEPASEGGVGSELCLVLSSCGSSFSRALGDATKWDGRCTSLAAANWLLRYNCSRVR
ncbi:hypothetical protein BHE74_00020477 [Ensete ventricosum]|nr:hypothetical protein GW17_00001590 [Ensete ventricosum]RWW71763.1 hypothetical protein BHE74_00020477 [Ensete ventricosum]RZR94192.1 hypothetical protein BHM03_00022846 [Ensete ventricosum]